MKFKINYKEIIKLIDLMEERGLSSFELEVEGIKIKMSRAQQPLPSPLEQPKISPEENSSLAPEVYQRQTPKVPPEEARDNLHHIKSPMVGTFYRAPDPNSPPFVEVGDRVVKNQTLCIIEAMKLMNEIESDIDGIVKEIHVENGSPVEYGQTLFTIKPL